MQTDTTISYARRLITDLLELDLDGKTDYNFDYKGTAFTVSPAAIRDITLILAAEYNNSLNKEILSIDRDELLRSQLFHLAQEAVRLADETKDPKFLRSLTQIYKDLKGSDVHLSADLETFIKCMKDLKPGISKEECIALIKKHSNDS